MNSIDTFLAASSDKPIQGEDSIDVIARKNNLKRPSAKPEQAKRNQSALLRGMRDPIDAGAQLLEWATPAPVANFINRANDWIVGNVPGAQSIGMEALGPEGLSGQLQRNEAAYQQGRKPGFDSGRLLGNVLSPANLAIAARGPQLVEKTLRAPVGSGANYAATGGLLGALSSPTVSETPATDKALQTAGGAIGGYVSPYIASGAARVIEPISKGMTAPLREAGVRLTPGQQMGGFAKRAEDYMKSSPWAGGAIERRQAEAIQQFNDAVFDRALKPIGLKLPESLKGNTQDALTYTRVQIGKAFDDILSKSKGVLDDEFMSEFSSLRNAMAGNGMDEKLLTRFNNFFDTKIKGRAVFNRAPSKQPALPSDVGQAEAKVMGRMSGDNVKMIDEALRDEAAKFAQSNDPFQREYGDAMRELHAAWQRMIERNNPGNGEKLSKIKNAYAQMKQAQRAGSSVTNDQGPFTPANYYGAIKAGDKTKDKRAFAEGTALNQDFGALAKQTMGNVAPDSGTAGRLNMTNLPGLAMTLPTAPLALIYSKAGNQMTNALLNQRFSDPMAKAIADFVRLYGPAATMPAAANLGAQGLLQTR